MYYTVYKITNLINNKIYIGVHKTKDINDNYMGSGKYLKRAQEKYGIENFRKEIIEVFDNAEDMFNMESQLVNEDFVKDAETYNLKVGGEGGWDYNNIKGLANRLNVNDSIKGGKNSAKIRSEKTYEELKHVYDKIGSSLREYYKENYNGFKGKSHTDETKMKMSKAISKKAKGEGNSQFGTMWIYSLTEKVSKKIKKEEFPTWEQEGWLKGRKMKF